MSFLVSGFETQGRRIDAYTAAALGDLETLLDLVGTQNINLKNVDGWTLLMYACYYARIEIVKFLITLGADKSVQCKKGRTALMIAALSGNVEIIPLVLQYELQSEILEFKEERGMTALCLTIEHGHQNAAEILLSMGANPDTVLGNGTPLIRAAEQGHFTLAKILLSYGANPMAVDTNGRTAVDLAIEKNHTDVVQLITAHVMAGVGDIKSTLKNLGLEAYLKTFEENKITFQQLINLTEDDMKQIGMKKFGPRRKLSLFIKQLKDRNGVFSRNIYK